MIVAALAGRGLATVAVDPLLALSDDFTAGGGTWESRGWSTFNANGGNVDNSLISGGVGIVRCVNAGTTDCEWFNGRTGLQKHKSITGDFDAVMSLAVRNYAGSGDPTGTYLFAGIGAHDPDRSARNYAQMSAGHWNTIRRGFSQHTVGNVSGSNTGASPGYLISTLLSYTCQLRLLRIGDVWTTFDRLLPSDGWTQRTSNTHVLPATLDVGPTMSSPNASMDVSAHITAIEFSTPGFGA